MCTEAESKCDTAPGDGPWMVIARRELLTEDDQEPADAVLFWWRADDGDVMDLVDALVDAQRSLDAGPVWIMTPRKGRPGHVSPADVAEAASTAGLHATTGAGASEDWAAQKLVQKRGG